MSKPNRICVTCGREYHYCNTCKDERTDPSWRNMFDTENCRTIFWTLSDALNDCMDKEEAKKILDKCDTTYILPKYQKEVETVCGKKEELKPVPKSVPVDTKPQYVKNDNRKKYKSFK